MSDQESRSLTDADREFNGRMIEELCEIGEKIVDAYAADIRKQTAAEQAGMTETHYKYAESLYLHGDLSGK